MSVPLVIPDEDRIMAGESRTMGSASSMMRPSSSVANDDLITHPAYLHWGNKYAAIDQGRESGYSTTPYIRVDPSTDRRCSNDVQEGYLSDAHHVVDGRPQQIAYVPGANGSPWGKAGAESASQQAAQDRGEAEANEALRNTIATYSRAHAGSQNGNNSVNNPSSPAPPGGGGPWSDWIWSVEHLRYWRHRVGPDGKVEYEWS